MFFCFSVFVRSISKRCEATPEDCPHFQGETPRSRHCTKVGFCTVLHSCDSMCQTESFKFTRFSSICFRTPLQNRQLDGAVHRVPPGFYDKGTLDLTLIRLEQRLSRVGIPFTSSHSRFVHQAELSSLVQANDSGNLTTVQGE